MQLWRRKAKQLKQEAYALYYVCKDRRAPWYVRLLAIAIVAYAFSPIDLIPDFIPLLGYLDDLILIPLLIIILLKLTPKNILDRAREKASLAIASNVEKPKDWLAAGIIISLSPTLAVKSILINF
jgi:uncharacterized membrane protein YkvA (DUF1232 family)